MVVGGLWWFLVGVGRAWVSLHGLFSGVGCAVGCLFGFDCWFWYLVLGVSGFWVLWVFAVGVLSVCLEFWFWMLWYSLVRVWFVSGHWVGCFGFGFCLFCGLQMVGG